MSRRSVTAAARAVRSQAHRVAEQQRRDLMYAEVVGVGPLAAELHGVGAELDDGDLVLGQWARRYNSEVGIDVGDTLVVQPTASGDWLVVEVVSEAAAGSGGAGGQTVVNVKDHGATGDGVADDRPGIQAAIDAAAGRGVIQFPAGVYRLAGNEPLRLPRDAVSLRLVGAGATLKLTATCYTAFWFQAVADYDNFQNVTIEDLVIDRDNVGVAGESQVILGASSWTRKNWRNITVRRVRVINCPPSVTSPQPNLSQDLRHIQILTTHLASNEVAQTVTEDIVVEDCDLPGGNTGVLIAGWGAGSMDVNHRHDRIRIENVRHDTLTDFTGVPLVFSANFHVGSRGFGEHVEIINCHGRRSGDVGIEINGFASAVLDRCTMTDAAQTNYLFRNYNATWATAANLARQRYTARLCKANRDLLVPTQAQSANNPMEGFSFLGGAARIGQVDLIDCSAYVRRQDAVGSVGRAIVGGAYRTNVERFRAVYPEVNSDPAITNTPGFPVQFPMPDDGKKSFLRVRGMSLTVAGTHTGAEAFSPRCMYLSHGSDVWADIDGLIVDCLMVGAVGDAAAAYLAGAILNGRLNGLNVVALGDSSGVNALQIAATAIDRFDVTDLNTRGTYGGDWFVASGVRSKVNFYNVRRWTHPRVNTSIVPSASPFVHQNTTGQAQQVLVSGGTVSLVEYSSDGTTYRPTGETSGAFLVSNGEYLRVTYTAAPTMWATYLR